MKKYIVLILKFIFKLCLYIVMNIIFEWDGIFMIENSRLRCLCLMIVLIDECLKKKKEEEEKCVICLINIKLSCVLKLSLWFS